jgi:hypothetical protein
MTRQHPGHYETDGAVDELVGDMNRAESTLCKI